MPTSKIIRKELPAKPGLYEIKVPTSSWGLYAAFLGQALWVYFIMDEPEEGEPTIETVHKILVARTGDALDADIMDMCMPMGMAIHYSGLGNQELHIFQVMPEDVDELRLDLDDGTEGSPFDLGIPEEFK
jgi:hypothetical protein